MMGEAKGTAGRRTRIQRRVREGYNAKVAPGGLLGGRDRVVDVGLALEDLDDRAEETGEGLLAEGRDAEAALAGHRAHGRSSRRRVEQREFCGGDRKSVV